MTIIHSLLHNTERFVNNDWAINTLSYHIHVFHTYTYIKFCNEIFFSFFTLEKYRTLMIGPLWLCFLSKTYFISLIKPETCCFIHQHLWRTRVTKIQDQCAKPRCKRLGMERSLIEGAEHSYRRSSHLSNRPSENPNLLSISWSQRKNFDNRMHG